MTRLRLLTLWSVPVLIVLPLLLLLPGCGGDDGESQPDNADARTSTITVNVAMQNLQPDEFEFTVPRGLPAGQLNEWGKVHLEDLVDLEANRDAVQKTMLEHLSEEEVERVFREGFVPRDATHLRDMIWARVIARSVVGKSTDQLAGTLKLFYYVVQNVILVNDDELDLPVSPFDSVMLGKGRAADRAWVFATLVRQLRLPFVVVETSFSENDPNAPFLGGVMIGEQLHLFDLRLGLPLPGPDDDGSEILSPSAGTLQQLAADDSPLRTLDQDDANPYVVTSGHLKEARLLVAGDTSLWSRRMQGLENALAGALSTVVFASLTTDGDYIGDLDRVQKLAGESGSERVGVWRWQEERREAREAITEEQQQRWDQLRETQRVPVPFRISRLNADGSSDIEFPQDGRMHQEARIHQVVGRLGKAIPIYLKIQSWRNLPPPARMRRVPEAQQPDADGMPGSNRSQMQMTVELPDGQKVPVTSLNAELLRALMPEEILSLHQRASEEAQFWRGCCQLQLEKFDTAARDFDNLLRRSPQSSMATPARYLAGFALARNGQINRAAAFIGSVPSDSPLYASSRILSRRWKAIAAAGEAENSQGR